MPTFFFLLQLGLLPGRLGEGVLELLRGVYPTVHYEHGPVLVLIDVVSLTVQTEEGEAGRAVQDGVAVGEGLGAG